MCCAAPAQAGAWLIAVPVFSLKVPHPEGCLHVEEVEQASKRRVGHEPPHSGEHIGELVGGEHG